MATNYPGGLDDNTSIPVESADTPLSTNHVPSHENLRDAVKAVQAKLGVDGSAVTGTVDYKLKSSDSVSPGHKHTLTATDFTDVDTTALSDGNGLVYNAAEQKWQNATTSVADASASVKGVTKLSLAPTSASDPISVGDNDGRVPSQDENDALQGTSGTPSNANRFITADDVSSAAVSGKVVRASGTALPALDGTNLTGIAKSVNVQTFTATGTWAKPTGAQRVYVRAWGGGGSGARRTSDGGSGGGGGGAYEEGWFDASDLGATEAATVGTGGAARTSEGQGNAGTDSTFGAHLTARGGNLGVQGTTNAAGANGAKLSNVGGLCTPITGCGVSAAAGEAGLYSGAGGGITGNHNGGASYFGGGGGGSAGGGPSSGGGSMFGGAGGGGRTGEAAIAGGVRGGGGGGVRGAFNSGAGGRGEIIVTTFF